MSQNPTDVSVVESIVEYNGLQDKDDSLNRPQGTSTSAVNVYDEQSGDCNRRAGRDFVSLEANPILVIYQFTWDDNSFSVGINSNADTTYVLPPVASSFAGPMPNSPNAEPVIFQDPYIPDFSSFIRAMAEAKQFSLQSSDLGLRYQHWALDFYNPDDIKNYNAALKKGLHPTKPKPIAAEVRDRKTALFYLRNHKVAIPSNSYLDVPLPVPNTDVKDDVYWVDYYVDRALILQDLTSLIGVYNALSHNFVKTDPIEDSTSIDNYDIPDDYNPPTPSFSQKVNADYWSTQSRELAKRINENLLKVKVNNNTIEITDSKQTYVFTLPYNTSCVVSHHPTTAWGFQDAYSSVCSLAASNPFASLSIIGGITGAASITSTRGRLRFDLTNFKSGTVDTYLKLETDSDFNSWPRPSCGGDDNFGKWSQSGIELGGNNYTVETGDVFPQVFSDGSGWTLIDGIAVVTRDEPQYKAQLPGGLYNLVIFPQTEYFKNTILGSVDTTETDLTFNKVHLLSDGAADRSIYSEGARTPFSTVYFSSLAPGFKKPGNGTPYKPSIFAILSLSGTAFTGSPTRIFIRAYINGNLIRTKIVTIVDAAFNEAIPYCFSILDVGDFTTFRPPDNNPNDEFNGWASPSVRFTAQVDTGSIYLNNVNLSDVVLNYPL